MYPIDQTSLLDVYFSFFNIYGDIYNGVPTADVNMSLLKLSIALANPKSTWINTDTS